MFLSFSTSGRYTGGGVSHLSVHWLDALDAMLLPISAYLRDTLDAMFLLFRYICKKDLT